MKRFLTVVAMAVGLVSTSVCADEAGVFAQKIQQELTSRNLDNQQLIRVACNSAILVNLQIDNRVRQTFTDAGRDEAIARCVKLWNFPANYVKFSHYSGEAGTTTPLHDRLMYACGGALIAVNQAIMGGAFDDVKAKVMKLIDDFGQNDIALMCQRSVYADIMQGRY